MAAAKKKTGKTRKSASAKNTATVNAAGKRQL